MKRRLLIVVVFLLAGAVVNVAVAWSISLIVNSYGRPLPKTQDALRKSTLFKIGQTTAFGTVSYSCRADNSTPRRGRDIPMIHEVLPRWASRHYLYTATQNTINASGWPLPVFSASIHSRGFGAHGYEVLGGIETPLEPFAAGGIKLSKGRTLPPGFGPMSVGPRVLPLRAIWTGLLVNTLFYAAVLWLLICGPFALRRFIRVKRGLCPACAYPTGQSDVCSECGKPLPQRARVTT